MKKLKDNNRGLSYTKPNFAQLLSAAIRERFSEIDPESETTYAALIGERMAEAVLEQLYEREHYQKPKQWTIQ